MNSGRRIGRAATVVAACLVMAALPVLPAAGQIRLPPADDGSTFTWPGATRVTLNIEPWGAGYVQSTPYLVDCPLACIRSFAPGTEITLTAHPTSGYTFDSWTGACEGQSNPCTLKTAGEAMGVIAVFAGRFVPPAPPASAPHGPSLSVNVAGDCPACVVSALGTGFHPNSSITLSVTFVNPPLGSLDLPGFATTDASGTWSFVGSIPCDFGGGPFVGLFVEDVTATDQEGASASGTVTANCVGP